VPEAIAATAVFYGGQDIDMIEARSAFLGHYAEELRATDQNEEADRIKSLAANAPENFLMVVPHKVQADPSISTE